MLLWICFLDRRCRRRCSSTAGKRLGLNLSSDWRADLSVRAFRGRNMEMPGGETDGLDDHGSKDIFSGGKGGLYKSPSFAVWDVSAYWRPAKGHELMLQIDNVTDKYYAEIADYPSPGRVVSVRYRYEF